MISNYLAHKILDEVLGGVGYTPPTDTYVALYTSMPSSSGSGGTEVTGGSYARVTKTNDATNWPAAASREKSNGTVVTFPQASAAWGSCVGVGVYDAISGGNLLMFGEFADPKTVAINDTPSFAVGQLKFTAIP